MGRRLKGQKHSREELAAFREKIMAYLRLPPDQVDIRLTKMAPHLDVSEGVVQNILLKLMRDGTLERRKTGSHRELRLKGQPLWHFSPLERQKRELADGLRVQQHRESDISRQTVATLPRGLDGFKAQNYSIQARKRPIRVSGDHSAAPGSIGSSAALCADGGVATS